MEGSGDFPMESVEETMLGDAFALAEEGRFAELLQEESTLGDLALAEEGSFAELLQELVGGTPQDAKMPSDPKTVIIADKRHLPDPVQEQRPGNVPKTDEPAASCASLQAYFDTLPNHKQHPVQCPPLSLPAPHPPEASFPRCCAPAGPDTDSGRGGCRA
eukprot:873913-Rhodomonas_salina.1